MQVGDLVRVPTWQLKRPRWSDHGDFGAGIIVAMTLYAVYVQWSNGPYLMYKMSTAGCLEVVA